MALGRLIKRWFERRGLAVMLLALAAVTHGVGLDYPREVIFDEVHFGKFVTAYCCTGERFFDIHPPHAKLLIAAAARLSGYRGNYSFENIGQPYDAISPLGFRLVPALMGTILPIIIYIILLQLGARAPAAFFGGLAVILDNAVTVQTRIIALDGILLVATFGSLAAYLAAERALAFGRRWVGWTLLAGALSGLAVGVKFTGLLALGLIGIFGLYRLATCRSLALAKRWAGAAVLLVVSATLIYAIGWALHFMILTLPGGGDAWGVPDWRPPIILSFLRETYDLHKTMYAANNGLTIFHHDASPWWGWPYMNTPVFYWQKSLAGMTSEVGAIYFIGNPIVWVGSTLLLLAAAVWALMAVGLGRKRQPFNEAWFVIPLVGYGLAYWPLTRVDRGLFLYHYLTPLMFAIMLGVLWLDHQGWFYGDRPWRQPWRVWVAVGFLGLFFLLFSPLTYGWLLNPDAQRLLFWFSSWR